MITRDALLLALNALLKPEQFRDYAPNGLQVEGKDKITRLITGVTSSKAMIEAAIILNADAILVHHGLFWRGQSGVITGWIKQRLSLLLKHNINLFAYHLPLDAHVQFGNNEQLAKILGFVTEEQHGEQNLCCIGRITAPFADVKAFAQYIQSKLNRSVILVEPEIINTNSKCTQKVERIAWCTGGAQSYFETAINAGVQVFLTGEISEPQAHLARECGVAYIACGHHASERYGVQAVGAHIAQQFSLTHHFIDIDNPA